jgi:IclR family transcriptional regulator, acetate operon repressor
MSKTLMRGLGLLETIDLHGPITITELARLSGIDTSIVSRTVSALERDGWIVRNEAKVELGPRAALLGHSSAAALAVRRAEPLVHAVAGATGLLTQAYGLVGTRAAVLAAAGGRGPSTPVGLGTSVPLFATAAGRIVATQLPSAELDRRLPPEPYPDPGPELASLVGFPSLAGALLEQPGDTLAGDSTIATDRGQLDAQLEQIRAAGVAIDSGELHPEMGCMAMPWPRAGIPAAIACMGSPADIVAADTLVRAALAAAISPRATPEEVLAKTAAAIRPSGTAGEGLKALARR